MADGLYELALSQSSAGALSEAAASYESLIALEPGNHRALTNLGRIYLTLNRPLEALAVLERAVALAPDAFVVRVNFASALHTAARFADAAAQWQAAIDLAPEDADTHYNHGVTLERLERLDEAGAAYARAVQLEPTLYEAWSNYAGVLLEQNQYLPSAEAGMRATALRQEGIDYYRLGLVAERFGDDDHAADHYRRAARLDPDNLAPYVRGADALVRLQKRTEAAELLRSYPRSDPIVEHGLNALENRPVTRAPADYVESLFDRFASTFDSTLEQLDYQGPRILAERLQAVAPDRARATLDLGCGTGLLGTALRPLTDELVGVDLSRRMLGRARARGIYDALHQQDLVTFLTTTDRRFDLVTGADVFNYFGDLADLFASIRRVLEPGGRLAFTLEDAGAGADSHELASNGRYRHERGYAEDCLVRAGFTLLDVHRAVLRNEHRNTVQGLFFCAALSPG